jgi:hypothetical protein
VADEGMPSIGIPPDSDSPIEAFVAFANVPLRGPR